MRKSVLSLCLVIVLILTQTVIFAETKGFDKVLVQYERLSGTVTISGKAEFMVNKEEPVRLMVLKPEAEGEDAVSNIEALENGTVTLRDVCIHIDETILNSDKSFSFIPFVIPETYPAGDYVVRLAGETTEYETVFTVATENQTIEKLSAAKSKQDVLSCLEKYNDVYKLDMSEESVYESLSQDSKDFVLENMLNKDYSTENVKDVFDLYVQLAKVAAGPWGAMESIINNYNSILKITPFMDDFNDLSKDEKDELYMEISKIEYEDADAFAKAFEKALKEIMNKEDDDDKKNHSSGGSSSGGRVSASITVNAEQQKPSDDGKQNQTADIFFDIENYGWAKESILALYKKGIVNGKGNGIFAPADNVTRAETVKMLVVALGLENESAECDFVDVDKNSWMYPYVAIAAKYGIIKGYEDNSAKVQNAITREDFATMINRATKALGKEIATKEEKLIFADNDAISEYAKEAVEMLQRADVIDGTENNMFLPKKVTTRAEAAKMIAQIIS